MDIPSSEKLLQMFDQIPGVVAFVSMETLQYEFVNKAFETAFGRPRNQIVGRHIKEIIGEANYQFALGYIAKVKNGESVSYENTFSLASGQRWIEVNYSPMRDAQGNVSTIAVLSNDITARKQAEAALQKNEIRFRQLADSTFEAIVIHDKGILLDVNAAFCRMFGYERAEVIGMSVMDLVAPESRSQVMENIRAGYEKPYENGIIRKDGTVVAIETIGRQIQYGDHVVRVTAMRDMTERNQAELALRESQKRLKLATESAQLGIWDWDIVHNQMHWDEQMFRLYGFEEKPESYGVEIWTSRLHPDDIGFAWAECQAALRGEKKYNVEFRVQHPDGAIRYIKADGMILRDSEGTAVRMLGINRDITDQKRAEEEHLKYERQLLQMQKLESIGILAGGIAHDFNNLMGGIFGFIDLAATESDPNDVSTYLSKAMATIDRARALTQQLLTFAKGGDPILKVGALFPFVEEATRFALSGANVSCRFDVPADLWPCNFDKNQLGQVIDNLVINAQQAMPLGGTIELSAQNVVLSDRELPSLASGEYVKLSIKDFGIGIPNDLLGKIFDPFFTTKSKGHGLGLATSYSIVNRHGGCIAVDSTPGKGSVFHVYLPASRQAAVGQESAHEATHRGSGTFLVMDDEAVIRETMGHMLRSIGYTVVSTSSGEEAVAFFAKEVAEKRPVAGMLFDLTVPGKMGGKAAVGEIKRINSTVPVFVASGYAEDPVMKNPAAYGFAASLCKPFRKSELLAMLKNHMPAPAAD